MLRGHGIIPPRMHLLCFQSYWTLSGFLYLILISSLNPEGCLGGNGIIIPYKYVRVAVPPLMNLT